MIREVEAGRFVPVHGLEQWVTLRSRRENPVLLIIPGARFLQELRSHLRPLA